MYCCIFKDENESMRVFLVIDLFFLVNFGMIFTKPFYCIEHTHFFAFFPFLLKSLFCKNCISFSNVKVIYEMKCSLSLLIFNKLNPVFIITSQMKIIRYCCLKDWFQRFKDLYSFIKKGNGGNWTLHFIFQR